ncbi:replication initiator protein RepSA [Streptomyces capparidis]
MPGTATPPDLDPVTLLDALRVAGVPDFDRWQEQIRRTRGCADPIHLSGTVVTRDATTGQTVHTYTTDREPGGRLRIACGNRRASRCPACAWTYAGDAFHLVHAGLLGGKGIPADVRAHPKIFATLTAPSFGPVHNRPDSDRCRCGTAHRDNDAALGTPLHPDRYDYAAAVLWNNHAPDLWRRFTINLRREIARRAGLTQRELREHARVSFGKVAEFQRRGAVHFHAIIRIDGPADPGDPPPAWATHTLLADAIRAAAARVEITVPAAGPHPARVLRWGTQLDARPIRSSAADHDLSEQAVAAYVAKYATKAAETTGTVDHRIGNKEALVLLGVPDHPRRLIEACLALHDAYPDRKLRQWAHMLGFRGHFLSKSSAYSTTFGALRQARADYRSAQDPTTPQEEDGVLVLAHWTYAGHGHTPGESWLAQTIANDIRTNREAAKQLRADLEADEGVWAWTAC